MHNTWCSRQWTLVVCHLHPLTSHASHAIDDQWTSTAPLLLYLLVDDTSYFPGLQSKLISRDWIALPILNAAKVKMLEERWSCNWLLIVRQPTLSHHRNACFSASFFLLLFGSWLLLFFLFILCEPSMLSCIWVWRPASHLENVHSYSLCSCLAKCRKPFNIIFTDALYHRCYLPKDGCLNFYPLLSLS